MVIPNPMKNRRYNEVGILLSRRKILLIGLFCFKLVREICGRDVYQKTAWLIRDLQCHEARTVV